MEQAKWLHTNGLVVTSNNSQWNRLSGCMKMASRRLNDCMKWPGGDIKGQPVEQAKWLHKNGLVVTSKDSQLNRLNGYIKMAS